MALSIKASFKMRLRANASLLTNAVDDEGHEDIRYEDITISAIKPDNITSANAEHIVNNQSAVLVNKFGELRLKGSGWTLDKVLNIFIDIFETNPIRGSFYIPTPTKFSNRKCGLINIQNEIKNALDGV